MVGVKWSVPAALVREALSEENLKKIIIPTKIWVIIYYHHVPSIINKVSN